MSTQSQFQTVFRVAKPDEGHASGLPQNPKRNRQSLSCLACRSRKLKCDRQAPCAACIKRRVPDSCSYANSSRDRGKARGPDGAEAQLRLQQLEEMVTVLIDNENKSPQRSPVNPLSLFSETSTIFPAGHLEVQGLEKKYVGATNWTSILENIREIQDVLEPIESDSEDQEDVELSSQTSFNRADIVFSKKESLNAEKLRNSLPPRDEVDRLLSVYFSSGQGGQMPVLHSSKFEREYESFWVDPSSVSVLWISMLFSILYVSSKLSKRSGKQTSVSENHFDDNILRLAGQALQNGGYQKARPYSVEAVLLYTMCKFLFKDDPDADAWILIGISARLAIRMGYHRDPRHHDNISLFEAEMRRRTFYVVSLFDTLFSFQAGLPATIQEEDFDTDPPRNLLDTDFDEDCNVLPPSRPITDSTPMLYYVYKSRLGQVFRRITRYALSLKPQSYDETMRLDGELQAVHADIPPSLAMKPLGLSDEDSTRDVLNRRNVNVMYLECLCVLHRMFLTIERTDGKFDYSRKTCLDAALQILDDQAQFYSPASPARHIPCTLNLHGSLLAAMITCLDLYECYKDSTTHSSRDLAAQIRKYDALRMSYSIWVSMLSTSKEASRAAKVLAALLAKVPRPQSPPPVDLEQTALQPNFNMDNLQGMDHMASETASWTVRGSTHVDLLAELFHFDSSIAFEMEPLDSAFQQPENIDWGHLDQYLLGWDTTTSGDIPFDWQLPDDNQGFGR